MAPTCRRNSSGSFRWALNCVSSAKLIERLGERDWSRVVFEGRLDSVPSITTNRGSSAAVYVLKGQASVSVSPTLASQLNLDKAASREYVSPTVGNCKFEVKNIGTTPGNQKVQFEFWTASEPDTASPPYCYLFVNEVKSNGLMMKLTQVPTYGGGGTIKTVTVRLTK